MIWRETNGNGGQTLALSLRPYTSFLTAESCDSVIRTNVLCRNATVTGSGQRHLPPADMVTITPTDPILLIVTAV